MSKRHVICITCMFEVSYIPLVLYVRYHMTSIFEVLPNNEILQTELTKARSQNKHQEKKAEPISRRYFLICQTCFWCASYIETMCNIDNLPYKACPTCNDNRDRLIMLYVVLI